MVKDWSYLAVFNRKDLPSLQNMMQHIRETHDSDMIEDINNRFEQRDNTLDNGIEVLDITKTEDLVVLAGLDQCIRIIQGTSSARWQYMGYANDTGTSFPNPSLGDQAIWANGNGETLPRINMSMGGWMEPKGMKLFFGAIIPESTVISSLNEMGIFNSSGLGTGIMLNHEIFVNNTLTRTIGKAVFMLSTVVEFCPVA